MFARNLKSLQKSEFVKPFSFLMLGFLTVIYTLPLVLADTTYLPKNSTNVIHHSLSAFPQNKKGLQSDLILVQVIDKEEQER
ncbi:hypothetical protein DP117_11055 [Brasilonema sp. UFV-L1]|nr:hypothetical protein [Brasilonema sp. UFV-L1]